MRTRTRLGTIGAATAVAAVAAAWAVAAHDPGPARGYTGCVNAASGTITKLKAGDEPLRPCRGPEIVIHVGDVSSVAAGAGLQGGAAAGSATLSLRPGFRLPQGCSPGDVAKLEDGAWACAEDEHGRYDVGHGLTLDGNTIALDWVEVESAMPTYAAGAGLVLSGTTFSLAPGVALPTSCAAGQVAKWNGSVWACAADVDTTSFAKDTQSCVSGQFATGVDAAGALVCGAASGSGSLAGQTCAKDQVVVGFKADGSILCAAAPAGPQGPQGPPGPPGGSALQRLLYAGTYIVDIGGTEAGPAFALEGCAPETDVVEVKSANSSGLTTTTTVPGQTAAPVCRIDVGLGMSKAFYSWMTATNTGASVVAEVGITRLDSTGAAVSRLAIANAWVAAVELPALHVGGGSGHLTVEVTGSALMKSSASGQPPVAADVPLSGPTLAVSVQGLTSSGFSGVGPLRIEREVVPTANSSAAVPVKVGRAELRAPASATATIKDLETWRGDVLAGQNASARKSVVLDLRDAGATRQLSVSLGSAWPYVLDAYERQDGDYVVGVAADTATFTAP